MKRHLFIALIATMLAFGGGAAFAADNSGNSQSGDQSNAADMSGNSQSNSDTYKAMDTDKDGQVSENEFNTYYDDSDIFDVWDANDDGWIDEDEFGAGLYGFYDDDDDGYISDAEWENGIMVDDYGDNGFWDL